MRASTTTLRSLFIAGFFLLLLCIPVSPPVQAEKPASRVADLSNSGIYLPLVFKPPPFESGEQPIWGQGQAPAQTEVALFRCRFQLGTPLEMAALHIFADTRYEAWLDGRFIGRGPARFSQSYWEYDVYSLEALPPGEHVLAVRVQWAPNSRRSESSTPMLISHIQGLAAGKRQAFAATGPDWKVMNAGAWRSDAAPVDTRGLIGPTELLDFSRLPEDWNLPAYADDSWSPVAISPEAIERFSVAEYAPRSIPFLEQAAIPAIVKSVGRLSPGFAIGEIGPLDKDYSLRFRMLRSRSLTIETVADRAPNPSWLALNNAPLTWNAAGPQRPDVYVASVHLASDSHVLTFSAGEQNGHTFAVSTRDVRFERFPFAQGNHAGRRTLLAALSQAPDAVQTVSGPGGLSLNFGSEPAYIILDLGRVVHGRLVGKISGPAGTVVDIGWDERWHPQAGRPLPYPGSQYPSWNQVDSWVMDGTERDLTTLDARAGRYILIAAWGGLVRLDEVRVLEERYPVTQIGAFHSSDPTLDRIWQVGIDTLRINMTDAYTDTPWRERGAWWGDAYVADRINRVVFGDSALMRRSLTLMAETMQNDPAPAMAPNNAGMHMLDYAMLWAQDLGRWVTQTGDRSTAFKLFPALEDLITHLQGYVDPASGLLDVPRDHWSRTALIDWPAYSSRYGQSTALNALYIGTLQHAATTAQAIAEPETAAQWLDQAQRAQDSLNSQLFFPDEGRYLTRRLGEEIYPPGVHAQAWALAYQLAPPERSADVAGALLELLADDPSQANVSPYGLFWVLEGLGKAGYINEGLDVIRLYYGYMLDRGASTWWETFDADQRIGSSYSHGWGSAPSWFLTTYVLGLRITGPGQWELRPALRGVDAVSGVAPLGDGRIEVSWERTTCGQVVLKIISPPQANGQVILPLALLDQESSEIYLDDGLLWRSGLQLATQVSIQGDELHISLGGGAHRIDSGRPCP